MEDPIRISYAISNYRNKNRVSLTPTGGLEQRILKDASERYFPATRVDLMLFSLMLGFSYF